MAYENRLRGRLAAGKPLYLASDPRSAEPTPPHLAEFAEEWLTTYAEPRLKPSTYADYVRRYRQHLHESVGSLRLDAINGLVIDRLTSDLVRKGLHPKSVNNVLGILRRMLASASEWGKTSGALPMIRWLKSPPSRFSFLSPVEAERLVAAAAMPPWRLMIMAALHTGLRLGELVALRWGDIDLERRQLCVQHSVTRGIETAPKNNRIRFVPLTRPLVDALRGAVDAPNCHVFVKFGSPVTHAMAWRALQTACARAGVRPVGWHALRHTFASHLAAENVPLIAIQAFLGHSDVKMTQRYAHIAPSALHGYIEGIVAAREHADLSGVRHAAVTTGEQKANKSLAGRAPDQETRLS